MTVKVNLKIESAKKTLETIEKKWNDGIARDYAITSLNRYIDDYVEILIVDFIDNFPVAVLEASRGTYHFSKKHIYINRLSGIGEGGGKRTMLTIKEIARRAKLIITVQSSADSKEFYKKYGFDESVIPSSIKNPYLLGWNPL